MGTIVATPNSAGGYVKLLVDVTATAAAKGVLLKRYPTGADLNYIAPAPVRGSSPLLAYNGTTPAKPYVKLSAGKAVYYDYEAPFDTPVVYSAETDADIAAATGPNLLINPSFETDTSGWSSLNANGTIARSTATFVGWPLSGKASALMTCGTAGDVAIVQYSTAVTPGLKYAATFAAYTATARNMKVQIDWQTTAGAYVSSATGALTAATPNTPMTLTVSGVAPATAAKANVYLMATAMAVGETFYADAGMFWTVTDASAATVSGPVILSGQIGIGWLKDPQRPGSGVPLYCSSTPGAFGASDKGTGVYLIGLAGRRFVADAKNMDIPGSARGSVAYAARKDFSSTLRLATRNLSDRDALEALLAPGAPLLLQLPAQYGERDQYIQVGEVQGERVHGDHRVPWRLFTLPYTVEDAPDGVAQGPVGTRWPDACAKYSSWTALKAAGVTWNTLAVSA